MPTGAAVAWLLRDDQLLSDWIWGLFHRTENLVKGPWPALTGVVMGPDWGGHGPWLGACCCCFAIWLCYQNPSTYFCVHSSVLLLTLVREASFCWSQWLMQRFITGQNVKNTWPWGFSTKQDSCITPTGFMKQCRRGSKKEGRSQKIGKRSVKCCLLDMTWPVHSRTSISCGCLHKTRTRLI